VVAPIVSPVFWLMNCLKNWDSPLLWSIAQEDQGRWDIMQEQPQVQTGILF
jgi:hypothetical protein